MYNVDLNDSNFLFALKEVLGIEAGYSDNKNDSGGKTNYGITEATARKAGFKGDMRNLTKDDAIRIYKKLFWDNVNLNLIKSPHIAKEVFEFGVNAGPKVAVKTLQRSYNALHNNFLLKEDGKIGKLTAKAVNKYKHPKAIYKTQNIIQGMYYLGLAEKDKFLIDNVRKHTRKKGGKNKIFYRGWINKRVNL